jgi:hypothetical protein
LDGADLLAMDRQKIAGLQSEAEQHGSAKYAYRCQGRAFDDTDAIHVISFQ